MTDHSIYSYNPSTHTYSVGPITIHFSEEANLVIGKYCSIAACLTILLGGNHRSDWISTYPFGHVPDSDWGVVPKNHLTTKGDVIIGNDVWIGYDVTILSGIHIGSGAVIAAKSVVTRDVKAYSITAGNPAKHKIYRFSADVRRELLNMQWWNWPDEKVRQAIPLLQSNDIDGLTKLRKKEGL
jgi:acetyltransferase-like isoleucine patch superfamily enzyme